MTSIDYYGTVKNQGYSVDPISVLMETNRNAGPAELEELCRAIEIDAKVRRRMMKEKKTIKY